MDDLLSHFFISFGLFSLFAVLGGFISARLKQPAVVGLLLVGMLMGPNMLGIVNNDQIINVLAELGAALLLFSIGLEFSLNKMLESSIRVIVVAGAIMMVLFVVGYEAGIMMGLGYLQSLLIGACFSFSSTAIFIRQMSHHKLLDSPQVPLLISVLVIEDIFAVTALTFFSSIKNPALSAMPSINAILIPILYSLVIMGFVYLVLSAAFKRAMSHFAPMLTQEYVILLALGLTVLLSMLAGAVGLSPSIGAFISGSILAGLPIKNSVEETMSPFSLAFSSYFFLSIGLLVSPLAFIQFLPQVIGLTIAFSFFSFLATAIIIYLIGYKFSDALTAGFSMAVLSEFSLLIAREAAHFITNFDIISVFSIVLLLTTVISSFFISKRNAIYNYLLFFSSNKISYSFSNFRRYVCELISEFEGGGVYLSKATALSMPLIRNFRGFIIIAIILLLINTFYGSNVIMLFGASFKLKSLILLSATMFFLPTLVGIFGELRLVADAIAAVFTRPGHGGHDAGRKFARNFILFISFYLLFIAIPFFAELLQLPQEFHSLDIVPIFAMAVLAWDTLSPFLSSISRSRYGGKRL